MPVTEKPLLGSTEIWEFLNFTEDVHPIHLHLVRFQVLDRRKFVMSGGQRRYTSAPFSPEPGEGGWKDTVRAYAGMSTRIIARFEGYAGRYVWHCHLLEHEDNEMMRPYEIISG
jgi:spore coat protein A